MLEIGLRDIHVVTQANRACFVFHPPSFTLVKIDAKAAGILADWERGQSSDAIAAAHGLQTTDVEGLLQTLNRLIQSQAQKHAAVLNSTLQNMPPVQQKLSKLVLNVSNTCNLACRYCYAQHGTYGKAASLMPEELARLALERTAEFFGAIEAVQFFGGEPTLNIPAIRAACEYLQAMYQAKTIPAMPLLGVVTNGFAWSDQFIELVGKYNLGVTVSLDGPASVNDLLRITPRGEGTFHQIALNIRLLQERSGGRQPSKVEVTYTKQHTALGVGFDDLYRFFVEEFGIQDVLIAPVSLPRCHAAYQELAFDGAIPSPLAEVSDDIVSSWTTKHPRQFDMIYVHLVRLAQQQGIRYLCGAGLTSLTVDAEGDVYPCFVLMQDDLRMGNIRDPGVFTGERFVQITEQFALHTKADLPNCPHCWARNFCHICFGVNNDATGSPWMVSERWCAWTKRSIERALVELGIVYGDRERWLQLVRNAQRYDPINNCFPPS